MAAVGCCGCGCGFGFGTNSTHSDSIVRVNPNGKIRLYQTVHLAFEMENCAALCWLFNSIAPAIDGAWLPLPPNQNTLFVLVAKTKRKKKWKQMQTKSQRINRQNNYRCFFFKHEIVHDKTQSTSQPTNQQQMVHDSIQRARHTASREKRKSWVCNLIVFAHYHHRHRRRHLCAHSFSPNEACSNGDQTTTAITNNCRLEKEQLRANENARSTWIVQRRHTSETLLAEN